MTSLAGAGDDAMLRRATRRISLEIAAVVTVVVFGLVAVAFVVVHDSQRDANKQLLSTAIAEADDVTDPPVGMWLVIRHGTVQEETRGMPAGLPDQRMLNDARAGRSTGATHVTSHGREYLIQTVAMAHGRVVQGLLDLTADHAEQALLVEACLVCGLVGLVVSVGVGMGLGHRAVAPLTEALALQRRFVADASHELRTPLTLLSTRAQLVNRCLKIDTDKTLMASDVEGLVADARHLADILDDLLVAADPRGVTGDDIVTLPDLVAQIVESLRPLAEQRGVMVTCVSDDRLPPVVGNRPSLRRAVTALLDNATRHAGTSVRVSVRRLGKDVLVDVADDGPGIAPATRTTMFERFAGSASDDGSGTRHYGLGLALVSEVAGKHGGSVSVVDTGRAGATLRLRLPASRRAEPRLSS